MTWPDSFTTRKTLRVGTTDTLVAEAGTGEPILFVHGNPDTHMVWSPVVEKLAARYRCIAPDLPGFGDSRAPADFDLSVEHQGDHVRGIADALELDRVHLVVHDIGATFGLAFAALHPQRIASVTIMNGTFFPDYRWHFWGRVWRTKGLGEIAHAIAPRPLFIRELRRGSPRMPRDYALDAWSHWTPSTKRMVLRWYRAMDPDKWSGWDTRLAAATASTPKLVLWGDLDPFIPSSGAEHYSGTIRHLADVGHWVMLEAPDVCAQAIDALIAPIQRGETSARM